MGRVIPETLTEDWERELEAAFFGESGTVDPPPVQEHPALLPAREPAVTLIPADTSHAEAPVPTDPLDPPLPARLQPETLNRSPSITPIPPVLLQDPPPADTLLDDEVIVVVPRWVWPTFGALAFLAIAGIAFALGVTWATWRAAPFAPSTLVTAPHDGPPDTATAPPADDGAAPPKRTNVTKKRRSTRPAAKRAAGKSPKDVTAAHPRAKTPPASGAKAKSTTKTTPKKAPSPPPAATTTAPPSTPKTPSTAKQTDAPPTPIAALPRAVPLSELAPGSTL